MLCDECQDRNNKNRCMGTADGVGLSNCFKKMAASPQATCEADVRLNNLLNAVSAQTARLRSGIEAGRIGTRSLVGDVVLDLESILKDYAD